MPALRNPRHERFAQCLFEGKPASTAYVEAGYVFNEGNSIRLKGNEKVQTRLAELQAQAARTTAITVESICAELDQANAVAKERGQASAMVSASALRAKLAGLMVERVEVGQPGDFDKCESSLDVATKLLELECRFIHVDDADRWVSPRLWIAAQRTFASSLTRSRPGLSWAHVHSHWRIRPQTNEPGRMPRPVRCYVSRTALVVNYTA